MTAVAAMVVTEVQMTPRDSMSSGESESEMDGWFKWLYDEIFNL